MPNIENIFNFFAVIDSFSKRYGVFRMFTARAGDKRNTLYSAKQLPPAQLHRRNKDIPEQYINSEYKLVRSGAILRVFLEYFQPYSYLYLQFDNRKRHGYAFAT